MGQTRILYWTQIYTVDRLWASKAFMGQTRILNWTQIYTVDCLWASKAFMGRNRMTQIPFLTQFASTQLAFFFLHNQN